MQMHDFKSHFRQDFLAYCTRPVSVHLVMTCVGCSFNSFSVFLLSLKQRQNLMKIMFSCIHFPVWPYPPKIMEKNVFYTGKLYGLTGMRWDSFKQQVQHWHRFDSLLWQGIFFPGSAFTSFSADSLMLSVQPHSAMTHVNICPHVKNSKMEAIRLFRRMRKYCTCW